MVLQTDPIHGFRFRVSIPLLSTLVDDESTSDLGFMRIKGLEATVGIYEWQEISDALTVRKLPDRIKFSDVVLERGVTPNRLAIWMWYEKVVSALQAGIATSFRSTVKIRSMMKGQYPDQSIAEWTIFDAYPKVISFGEFSADSSAILIETLTLANEGYRFRLVSQSEVPSPWTTQGVSGGRH